MLHICSLLSAETNSLLFIARLCSGLLTLLIRNQTECNAVLDLLPHMISLLPIRQMPIIRLFVVHTVLP